MSRLSSLTSRLVLTAVALVVLVSVLSGAAATLALHASLTRRLDREVLSSLQRAGDGDRERDRDGDGAGEEGGARVPRPDARNQQPGTLIAFLDSRPGGCVLTESAGECRTLPADALTVLARVPADRRVHGVELPGAGSYRVTAIQPDADSDIVVTGLPTADLDDTIGGLVAWEALLILVGALAAAGAGTFVVRRQLRPLREVAATAHAVAELPLSSEVIDLQDRVPAHLTDERTEVGQVGSALNALLAHVGASLDARHRSELQVRQFVADASHELRSPLATIVGYTELARTRPDEATLRTALAKVEEESGRMTSLVEDLLLLARLDAGRPLDHRPVDLTRLLLEAVSDARVLAPDHHWRLDLPSEAVEVVGDEQGLHQVATNLLTNARKYTPAGTTVTVRAGDWGLSVHDDGPGFPPEVAPYAFERFARGDSSRTRTGAGGVGLGLALVRAIATAHGGRVTLESEPGNTRITVLLGDSQRKA